MTSSGFQAASGWKWPDEVPQSTPEASASTSTTAEEPRQRSRNMPGWYEPDDAGHAAASPSTGSQTDNRHGEPRRQRHYQPRQCRICLETVLPTFHPPTQNLPGIFQSVPNVTYESEEGRLIRPCKCKGSSRYVHEGCLESWRHADPSYARRNYWQCPTCGFRYRLERMTWGRLISSTAAQICLTLAIFMIATFGLGFIADPIINLYLDPYGTLIPFEDADEYVLPSEELPEGWSFHFVKGFAALGLVSFLKFVLTNPLRFFNIRVGGYGGTVRTGNTGRDRLANVSRFAVAVGIATFIYGVWKAVRAWSRRLLEKARERVMDVQGEDDDDEDDGPGSTSNE